MIDFHSQTLSIKNTIEKNYIYLNNDWFTNKFLACWYLNRGIMTKSSLSHCMCAGLVCLKTGDANSVYYIEID